MEKDTNKTIKKEKEVMKKKQEEEKEIKEKKENVEEIKEKSEEETRPSEVELKKDKKTEETKKPEIKKQEKTKKIESIVRGYNIPISTKQSIAICKFIKGKKIGDAIRYLEKVASLKNPIPMKGEIPHRKGKIMSGRFPKKAAQNFIVLLKSLVANASDIDEPIIIEAIANIGERPYGRFGAVRKKRTHICIKARGKVNENNNKKNGRKKSS